MLNCYYLLLSDLIIIINFVPELEFQKLYREVLCWKMTLDQHQFSV